LTINLTHLDPHHLHDLILVLHVCRVLLISAPFMHCVHHLAPRVLHFSAAHCNCSRFSHWARFKATSFIIKSQRGSIMALTNYTPSVGIFILIYANWPFYDLIGLQYFLQRVQNLV